MDVFRIVDPTLVEIAAHRYMSRQTKSSAIAFRARFFSVVFFYAQNHIAPTLHHAIVVDTATSVRSHEKL